MNRWPTESNNATTTPGQQVSTASASRGCSTRPFTLTPRDELVLHLTDDGIGLQGKPVQPGMGSTVISAWVESLRGEWSLEQEATGVVLTATIPAV